MSNQKTMTTKELKKEGLLKVNDLAKEFGVSASAIDHWADTGLLPCQQSDTGYRFFDLEQCRPTIERLRGFRQAKKVLTNEKNHFEEELKEGFRWRNITTTQGVKKVAIRKRNVLIAPTYD